VGKDSIFPNKKITATPLVMLTLKCCQDCLVQNVLRIIPYHMLCQSVYSCITSFYVNSWLVITVTLPTAANLQHP